MISEKKLQLPGQLEKLPYNFRVPLTLIQYNLKQDYRQNRGNFKIKSR
ncbi:MAG: hypothetical protein MUF15_21720 [Acidobacteria bacterium]|nr:hypothetical protein [Acidobacteriota bacterium]